MVAFSLTHIFHADALDCMAHGVQPSAWRMVRLSSTRAILYQHMQQHGSKHGARHVSSMDCHVHLCTKVAWPIGMQTTHLSPVSCNPKNQPLIRHGVVKPLLQPSAFLPLHHHILGRCDLYFSLLVSPLQLGALSGRLLRNTYRHPFLVTLNFVATLCAAIAMGLIFRDSGVNGKHAGSLLFLLFLCFNLLPSV